MPGFNELIDNLKQQITSAKQRSNKNISTILDTALETLHTPGTRDETQLLDLYITAKGIVTIALTATEQELPTKIRYFFATRANKMKGQTGDCNSVTPANTFCLNIATVVFPRERAQNVLLEEALTKNRAEPWMDYIEYSTDLPPVGTWFRNQHDAVHMYLPILDGAIVRLKEGYTKQNDIWLGTDARFATQQPLTADDLNIIRQRTPTFSVLVDYTSRLEAAMQSQTKNAFEHFHELRQGLLKGDAAHGGQELQAGAEAYVAIAIFSEWWNRLSATTRSKINALTISCSSFGMNRMVDILKVILDDGNARQRDGVQYCIKLKGQRLDEFLNHPIIRQQLETIEEGVVTIDPRIANKILDQWQQKISAELETVKPLIHQENRLSAYAQSKGIVLHAFLNGSFDLNLLESDKISKPIHWWHQKYPFNQIPINPNLLSSMIKDIYAQQDMNVLMLLYANYAYQPQKDEKVVLTALKTRLHDLSKMQGFSFQSLRTKYPFFDTLSLKDEEIAYPTFVEKFVQPSTAEDWLELITYLTHCNPDWLTPEFFQQVLERAIQANLILHIPSQGMGESPYNLLKAVYAEKVLRKEIATYKRTFANRLGQRHDNQRDDSIARIEEILNQPLTTRTGEQRNAELIALIKAEMVETQVSHKSGFFSWFTNSHLVQAYKRALFLINPDDRPPPSWWERFIAWFRPSTNIPGITLPPPPPPGAAGAAAVMHVNVEHYMPRIQAEVAQWQSASEGRVQFRQSLITLRASFHDRMATISHALSRAEVAESATRVDSEAQHVQEQQSTYGHFMGALASHHSHSHFQPEEDAEPVHSHVIASRNRRVAVRDSVVSSSSEAQIMAM